MKPTQNISEVLISLLRRAGEIMLSAHEVSHNEGGGVKVKPGTANFVTVYDVAVQEFLINAIKEEIPDAVFIAEEKENDSAVLMGEHCFIIDPIDGTTNFIHDYKRSSISLAMISRGETVFGAVYDPYLNELFHAEKGKGAYLNETPIHVSDREIGYAVVAFGTCPYYKDTLADNTFALAKDLFLVTSDVRRPGSAALDLSYVAAGRNDLFFELILSPWDIAAGALIITEAGGVITQGDGAPIDLSAPCPVFAGNPVAHPELLRIAAKYV
jgi:myo-inositol-1(or 4)-monophosphatase